MFEMHQSRKHPIDKERQGAGRGLQKIQRSARHEENGSGALNNAKRLVEIEIEEIAFLVIMQDVNYRLPGTIQVTV